MSQHQGQRGPAPATGSGPPSGVVEEIEVRGHIVDSLLLPKILDRILLMGGSFEIRECKIGVRRSDPSYARIAIRADGHEALEAILGDLVEHGASPVHPEDAQVVPADIAGAFPEAFYSTTNQPTQVRLGGRWVDVDDHGDGLRDRGRPGRRQGAVHPDDPRRGGHADRGRPRGGAACCRSSDPARSARSAS